MEVRRGERRSHPRFEIVGALVGSFDMRRECQVSNVGARGALVSMPEFVSVGTSVAGRMLLNERAHEVSGVVRHVTSRTSSDGETGYMVGLDFRQPMPELSADAKGLERTPLPRATVSEERRASERYDCEGAARMQFPSWGTAEIQDISAGGTMFTAASRFTPGSRGQIRTRVGERRFAAEIEVLWSESSAGAPPFRVGVSFMSMDPESKAALVSLLTPGGLVTG